MNAIKRELPVEITPSVEEVADLIWNMNCEEQAELIVRLAEKFNTPNGILQLSYIADEVVSQGDKNIVQVGRFAGNSEEYFGYETLCKARQELKSQKANN